MATFTNNFYGGKKGYNLCLDVTTNSQNAANNTSNVTVKVRLVSLGSSYTISSSTSKDGSVTIDGTKYTFTFTAGLTGNQNKTLYTKTLDIAHNSDGTKTLSVSATCYLGVTLSGTFHGNTTVSGSTALTAIPRSTPVSISGTGTFGSEKWIGHSRASTAFTVTLRYSCGNESGTIVSKSATNETYWAPPKSLQSQIPKATSITITVYCDTYSGNTLIGTTSTSFTCYVASDCVPTLSSLSCTNVDTGGTYYWQTVSKLRAEVGCAGAYGSTITKYVMEVDGQTITNYGYIIWSGVLNGSGAKDVKITVTDSRGKTATKTWTSAFTVTAYAKPSITKFTCKRTGVDESGNEVNSNLGTNGYFTATASFHSSATTRLRLFKYKPSTSSAWTSIYLDDENQVDYKFSTALSAGSAYNLKYVMMDNVCTVEQDIVMQNLYPLINMNAAGNAIAFGKECNADNRFMVEMDASFNKWVGIWSLQVTGNSLFQGDVATFDSTVKFNDTLYFGDNKFASATTSDLSINNNKDFGMVYIHGATMFQDRGSYNSVVTVKTGGDGNTEGDGNTYIGYYQSNNGGYGHYFRGLGQFFIDNAYGLNVRKGNMRLSSTGWLMADKMQYNTSGGWVDSSSAQTWGVGCANHFLPTESTRYLGTASHRWEKLYCVSSPSVSSDARNKENVKYMYNQPEVMNEYTDVKENDEITTRDLLDFVVNDLYMVTYDYKQETEGMEEGEIEMVTAMNNRQIGFIAQDIENTKVGKYLITKDKEGVLSYESANWPSIIAGALQQEIRDRQAADKELMDMLQNIINE